jgi:adenylate cyclase
MRVSPPSAAWNGGSASISATRLSKGDNILGDGVNIAVRLEGIAEPGGICIWDDAFRQVRGKIEAEFVDAGEQSLKNIARPLRVYRIASAPTAKQPITPPVAMPLPDKPSLAVLPFQNLTGDAEQEYFVDGMVEEITTAIARLPWLFVIVRNSAFTYKGKPVRYYGANSCTESPHHRCRNAT